MAELDLQASALYRRLRRELLGAALHHRKAFHHPDLVTDMHRSYLDVYRRQLGALRQAYRRTREVAAWNRYVRAREATPLPHRRTI
ncbi:MAG: hypothetical protein VKP62_15975 [Candidatus Sericytochromatia bacterium]|nr:hypothetical protein [Candidatus Sericytochromatia bacterium]